MIDAIVTHFQVTQTDEELRRALEGIAGQPGLGAIHVFHDGPLFRPWPEGLPPCYLHSTPERKNVFGHNLRHLGIFYSDAEYVWISNADNVLFPGAFQAAVEAMPFQVFLFSVRDFRQPNGGADLIASKQGETGLDCMQAIVRRSIWVERGGWTDHRQDSDATQLRDILALHAPVACDDIIRGEHR